MYYYSFHPKYLGRFLHTVKIMHLDVSIMSRCIVPTMYLEKLK
jgi:hypothetical protein